MYRMIGEIHLIGSICIHDIDFGILIPFRLEGNLLGIGRPFRSPIEAIAMGWNGLKPQ